MGSQRLTGVFVRAGFILFPVMVATCGVFTDVPLSLGGEDDRRAVSLWPGRREGGIDREGGRVEGGEK